MGLYSSKSSHSYSCNCDCESKNPDPNNYRITEIYDRTPYIALKVTYDNCTNYKGKKILVYTKTSLAALMMQKSLDPHFSDDKKYIAPYARFKPTEKGWEHAKLFIEMLINLENK